MTLENHGDLEVSILKRSTAWDRAARVFSITHEKENVPYLGPVAFRLPPADSEFHKLLPGEEATVTYDISRQYEVTEAGEYAIALRSSILNARVGGTDLVLQHNCGVLSAFLEPNLIGQAEEALQFPQPVGFTCTASEQAGILRNNELARQAVPLVKAQLASNFRSISSIYQRWFGAYNPNNLADVNRLNYVTLQIARIQGADTTDQQSPQQFHWNADCRRDNPPYGIVCSVTGSTADVGWAWYGSYDIHFCQNYLTAFSPGGWTGELGPSLAAIVIHEKTHEIDIGIGDPGGMEVHGLGPSLNLAITNPDAASKNAENYGFFVADAHVTNRILVPTTSPLY